MQFKTFLRSEFVRRCKNNPSYSLRSFAKQLSINHSSLSRILNGKRDLSDNMIERLSLKLGLSPEEVLNYTSNSRKQELSKNKAALQLSADQFRYVSEWYYLALIELIKIYPNESESFYAERFDLKGIQIQLAFESLQRLNLLSYSKEFGWEDLTGSGSNSCTHTFTTDAKKNYQKQVFKMALEAIDDIEINRRSHSGVSMAINSKKIDEARLKIAKFREEICDFLQDGELDEVYHLGVGLFPMTKINNKENKNED